MEKYDSTLLSIFQNEGKHASFMDTIFSFLYRRTDYFFIAKSDHRLGLPPGLAKKLLMKIYSKYELQAEMDAEQEEIKLIRKTEIDAERDSYATEPSPHTDESAELEESMSSFEPDKSQWRKTVCRSQYLMEYDWFQAPFATLGVPFFPYSQSDIGAYQRLIWENPSNMFIEKYGHTVAEMAVLCGQGKDGCLTSSHIEWILKCANTKNTHSLCICMPTMSTEYIRKIYSSKISLSKLIFVINVQKDINGDVSVASTKHPGNNWVLVLVVAELGRQVVFYCDSLGWSMPSKLLETLSHVMEILNIDFVKDAEVVQLHNPFARDSSDHSYTSSSLCRNYPLLSCDNLCGIVAVISATAIALNSEFLNFFTGSSSVIKTFLHDPVTYEKYLRRILISWFINGNLNVLPLKIVPCIDHNNSFHEVLNPDHNYYCLRSCNLVMEEIPGLDKSFSLFPVCSATAASSKGSQWTKLVPLPVRKSSLVSSPVPVSKSYLQSNPITFTKSSLISNPIQVSKSSLISTPIQVSKSSLTSTPIQSKSSLISTPIQVSKSSLISTPIQVSKSSLTSTLIQSMSSLISTPIQVSKSSQVSTPITIKKSSFVSTPILVNKSSVVSIPVTATKSSLMSKPTFVKKSVLLSNSVPVKKSSLLSNSIPVRMSSLSPIAVPNMKSCRVLHIAPTSKSYKLSNPMPASKYSPITIKRSQSNTVPITTSCRIRSIAPVAKSLLSNAVPTSDSCLVSNYSPVNDSCLVSNAFPGRKLNANLDSESYCLVSKAVSVSDSSLLSSTIPSSDSCLLSKAVPIRNYDQLSNFSFDSSSKMKNARSNAVSIRNVFPLSNDLPGNKSSQLSDAVPVCKSSQLSTVVPLAHVSVSEHSQLSNMSFDISPSCQSSVSVLPRSNRGRYGRYICKPKTIKCPYCHDVFSSKQNLRRHKLESHQSEFAKDSRFRFSSCELCNEFKAPKICDLISHYSSCHNHMMDICSKVFDNESDFLKWRKEQEIETCTRFKQSSGVKVRKMSKIKIKFFYCQRSGYRRHLANRKRAPRKNLIHMLENRCTAYMKATTCSTTGCVWVEYCLHHIGHSYKLGNVFMSSKPFSS